MEDKKLLNIIKDYFRENFESVVENHDPFSPISRNAHSLNGKFGKIQTPVGSDFVIGEVSIHSFKINVGKFDFEVYYERKRMFMIPVSHYDYSSNYFNSENYISENPLQGEPKEICNYKVIVKRLSEEHDNYPLLTKELDIDEKYFTEIEKSIEYNEDRMLEELNDLLSDLRNKKIDKITKE